MLRLFEINYPAREKLVSEGNCFDFLDWLLDPASEWHNMHNVLMRIATLLLNLQWVLYTVYRMRTYNLTCIRGDMKVSCLHEMKSVTEEEEHLYVCNCCACMCVCNYAILHNYIHTHTHTQANKQIPIMYACVCLCVCVFLFVRIWVGLCRSKYICVCLNHVNVQYISLCMYVCVYLFLCVCMHDSI